jgi:hypothetical protein
MSLTVYLDVTVSSKTAQLALASSILALSKIPNVARVCAYGSPVPLLEKVPRSVKLDFMTGETFEKACFKDIQTDKSDLVYVASTKHAVLPEALGCACAAFQSLGVDYVQLEDVPSPHAVMVTYAMRFWKLPSYSAEARSNFVARRLVICNDLDTFVDYAAPFDFLDAVRGRKISTPLPSLSCALPLASNAPPMIQWPAILQMIEQLF